MRPPHERYPRWRSLSNAFMVWLSRQDEIVRAEVVATKRQGRVILAFPRLLGLSGWVRSNCLAVYAVGESGDADPILELESLPIRLEGTQTFVCGFCEGDRRHFDGRETLWADHLFEPFGEWMKETTITFAEHRGRLTKRPGCAGQPIVISRLEPL